MSGPNDTPVLSEKELFELAFGKQGDPGRGELDDSALGDGSSGAAAAVMAVALTEKLSDESKAILRDFYMALQEEPERGDYILKIRQRKPGQRPLSGEEKINQWNNDSSIARMVDYLTDKIGKKEAAVAAFAEMFGHSRASIFRAIRRNNERKSQYPEG